jgi:hypothetical protein
MSSCMLGAGSMGASQGAGRQGAATSSGRPAVDSQSSVLHPRLANGGGRPAVPSTLGLPPSQLDHPSCWLPSSPPLPCTRSATHAAGALAARSEPSVAASGGGVTAAAWQQPPAPAGAHGALPPSIGLLGALSVADAGHAGRPGRAARRGHRWQLRRASLEHFRCATAAADAAAKEDAAGGGYGEEAAHGAGLLLPLPLLCCAAAHAGDCGARQPTGRRPVAVHRGLCHAHEAITDGRRQRRGSFLLAGRLARAAGQPARAGERVLAPGLRAAGRADGSAARQLASQLRDGYYRAIDSADATAAAAAATPQHEHFPAAAAGESDGGGRGDRGRGWGGGASCEGEAADDGAGGGDAAALPPAGGDGEAAGAHADAGPASSVHAVGECHHRRTWPPAGPPKKPLGRAKQGG